MIEMIGVKGAGDAPQNYFRENAAYARPKLEHIARGSGPAAVKVARDRRGAMRGAVGIRRHVA